MRRTSIEINLFGGTAGVKNASVDSFNYIAASAVETAQLVEAQTVGLTLTPSAADIAQFVDSDTEVLALTPSATETAQFVDSTTEAFILTPSSTDIAQFVDAATEGLALTPSSTDIAQYVDADVENLALTPSSAEEHTTFDAGTELFALTPSSTDTAQYVDASTETFALTPSDSQVFAGVDVKSIYFYLEPSIDYFSDDFDDNSISSRWRIINDVREQNGRFELWGTNSQADMDGPSGVPRSRMADTISIKLLSCAGTNASFRGFAELRTESFSSVGLTGWSIAYKTNFGSPVFSITHTDDLGVSASPADISAPALPVWIRARRTFPGYVLEYSTNGTSWTSLYTDSNDYRWMRRHGVRLTVTGGSAGVLNSAFDDFVQTATGIETAQFVDTRTVGLALTPSTVNEEHTTYDADTEIFALTPSGTDDYTVGSVEYTDTETELFALTPSSTDIGEFTDAASVGVSLSPSGTEAMQNVDSDTERLGIIPSSTDTADFVDAATELFSLVPSASDTKQTTDAQTEVLALTPSSTDAADFFDNGREDFSLIPTATDTAQYVDANTETLHLTPTADESLSGQTFDTATELFALVPSGTENYVTSDSDVETLLLLPSSDDLHTIFDSNTETLSLVPSSTDVGDYVDVLTEVLTLTPSGDDIQILGKIDEGTLYLHLTPASIEVLKFIKLVGRLLQRYSGELDRRYLYRAIHKYIAEVGQSYSGNLRSRY